MSEQPQWTTAKIASLYNKGGYPEIVDAINAALAAAVKADRANMNLRADLLRQHSEQPQEALEVVLRNICDYAHILPEYENEIRRQLAAELKRSEAFQEEIMLRGKALVTAHRKIENLHRILGRKRTEIKELKEKVSPAIPK